MSAGAVVLDTRDVVDFAAGHLIGEAHGQQDLHHPRGDRLGVQGVLTLGVWGQPSGRRTAP